MPATSYVNRPFADLRHIRSGRRCLRQHRNLLLDTEPAPPFHAPQYLGNRVRRYTHRVAISNRRLIALDERSVTFKVKDFGSRDPAALPP
jgi:hypothetical protein